MIAIAAQADALVAVLGHQVDRHGWPPLRLRPTKCAVMRWPDRAVLVTRPGPAPALPTWSSTVGTRGTPGHRYDHAHGGVHHSPRACGGDVSPASHTGQITQGPPFDCPDEYSG
jgi:hypothetical protein